MADYVYRIVRRRAGSDDDFEQDNSYGSRTGRPYVKESVAKGEVTRRKYYDSMYEYKVQRSLLNWDFTDD
jgi:hypothetical protein